MLRLSDSVYGSASVAAIGVAAHECGHAIQDDRSYAPLRIRNSLVPIANIGTQAAWPIIQNSIHIHNKAFFISFP